LNDREADKIMVDVVNKRRVFSRIVTGHCDLSLVVSKLSWSLAIDQITHWLLRSIVGVIASLSYLVGNVAFFFSLACGFVRRTVQITTL
jgi:hypothetical protein